ncbi:MAG: C4-dicarboxylate ABC transporter, partial [Pseudomonadota bacterium]
MFSKRAIIVAVITAFVAGIILSLAIRPPGERAAVAAVADGEGGEPVRIRWRVPMSSARNLPGTGPAILWMAEELKRASNGAILLDLNDPGEIVPAFAITDAVRERKVEAGVTWVGYDQGKIPSAPLFSAVPFGFEPWAFMAWWYYGGGRELGEEVYAAYNIKPILCAISGPETAGWFREPIQSTSDVEGLKIRFAGLGGKVMQNAGASVTMLPAGEIFQALETGVIDATEYAQPISDQALGFNRIAKYNYFPGWH